MTSVRSSVAGLARRLPVPAAVRNWGRILTDPLAGDEHRRHRAFRAQLEAGRVPALTASLPGRHGARGPALVASVGYGAVLTELGLIRCLAMAGYDPVVLGTRGRWPERFARSLGCRFIDWKDRLPAASTSPPRRIESASDLLRMEHRGIRVGRFAASTALRDLRTGELDFSKSSVRDSVAMRLGRAERYADAVHSIVDDVQPSLALFVDRGYTPAGELFDLCLDRGIPGVTWNTGHRSNTLVFKRYSRETRDVHPFSLSESTWKRVRSMEWTNGHEERLRREIEGTYASGDWFSEVGTQFRTKQAGATQVREAIGLRPDRKVAIIFPHIVWDGTFFWGTDLFGSYERWLVETVRAAARNPAVDWVVKIHPANLIKDAREGLGGMPADERCIRAALGTLPLHVKLVPADSPISTHSLYSVADYAVTVRGTVGIEAATFGIPVLTAGTGRYDRLGFTVDHASSEQYLERLGRIQDVPRLLDAQTELAKRYAYGVFVLRTLPLDAMSIEFRRDRFASMAPGFRVASFEEWAQSADVQALVQWLPSSEEDLIVAPGSLGAVAPTVAASQQVT